MEQARDLESLSAVLARDEDFSRPALLQTQKRLKTGFEKLDDLLGGGFSAGLVVLGGSPGAGKSTLALRIARNIARSGTPVRYYSYEMTTRWILGKLMACENYESGNPERFTAEELFNVERTEKWSAKKWSAYQEARKAVLQELDNLYVVDCNTLDKRYTASQIREDVDAFVRRSGKRPVVIVDYLQILPAEDKKQAGNERLVVEESLESMVALYKHLDMPVLLISSLSRNYYTKPVQIDSFKETGSIEYSADVLLGLQFSACHDKNGNEVKWEVDTEKRKKPREVELVVLKQRYGQTGTIPLRYRADYDFFTEDLTLPQKEQIERKAVPELAAKCCINNTKIARQLRRGMAVAGQELRCKVFESKTDGSDVITTYEVSDTLSCFDCDVADAVYSIFLSHKERFSLRHVLTTLTGDDSQTLTRQKAETLRASIQKLRSTRITIRCEQEMRERYANEVDREPLFAGAMLTVIETEKKSRTGSSYTYTFSGMDAEALRTIMPLYAYAQKTKQIVSFPQALLDMRAAAAGGARGEKLLSDTAEAIAVKHFLFNRLEVIRNNPGTRERLRTIAFGPDSELLELLHNRPKKKAVDWKQESRQLRKTIRTVLDYLKRIGYIEDYEFTENGSVSILQGKKGNTSGIRNPWKL